MPRRNGLIGIVFGDPAIQIIGMSNLQPTRCLTPQNINKKHRVDATGLEPVTSAL